MTRDEIERAANARYEDNTFAYKGFIAGAQWRINFVWHDASEKPNKNQLVLFECRKAYRKGYSVNFGENYELMKNVIVRWAYVIDLLPERKEETK